MFKSLTRALVTASAVLLLPGCGQVEPESAPVAASEPVAELPTLAETPASEPEVDPSEKLREAMAAYLAPFPDRADMFVPPKDAPTSTGGPRSDGDVQLRGLVDVGEPQAILDIEGAIALVKVGDEKFGVKVVAIENQKVTLQRGPTRWTASLD